MVKRLRHRPFTAVTRVRVPVGSPLWGSETDPLFLSGVLTGSGAQPLFLNRCADVVELADTQDLGSCA